MGGAYANTRAQFLQLVVSSERPRVQVHKRTMARPPLRRTDRLFWVVLARVWTGWRRPLVMVTPNTVLRWQRRRFREYWTKLSARPTGGRPPVSAEIKDLVRPCRCARRHSADRVLQPACFVADAAINLRELAVFDSSCASL